MHQQLDLDPSARNVSVSFEGREEGGAGPARPVAAVLVDHLNYRPFMMAMRAATAPVAIKMQA
jgi:hypothetical protein